MRVPDQLFGTLSSSELDHSLSFPRGLSASPSRMQTYSPLERVSSETIAPIASGKTLTPRSFTMLSLRP